MDPDANLEEQRRIIARMLDKGEHSFTDSMRLAELARSLDEWIGGDPNDCFDNGSLPKAWKGPFE